MLRHSMPSTVMYEAIGVELLLVPFTSMQYAALP